MNFCRHCGSKLNEGAVFCGECGKRVQDVGQPSAIEVAPTAEELEDAWVETQSPVQPSQVSAPVQRKPMTKKQKVTLITLLSVAAVLFVSYLVLKNLTDPVKMLERFEVAIEEKDGDSLMSLLSSGSSKVKLEENHVQGLIDFLNEEERVFDELMTSLENQLKNLEKGDKVNSSPYYLKLEKDGKKFLLFDNYKIVLQPVNIYFSSNYANVDFYLNDEKVGTSKRAYEDIKYGPVLPGNYKVKSELKGQFASAVNEMEVNLFEERSLVDDIWLLLELEADSLEIYTNYDDVEIFINGESAGKSDGKRFYLDVINIDGSNTVYAKKEFPWGVAQSEELTIIDDYIDLDINPFSAELEKELANVIKDFYLERNEAFKTMDASKLTSATDDILDEINDNLDYYSRNEYKFFGDGAVEVTVDLDTFDLDSYEGVYEAYVMVRVVDNGDFYSSNISDDRIASILEQSRTNNYQIELKYDTNQNRWFVTDEYRPWFASFYGNRVEHFTLVEQADEATNEKENTDNNE